MRSLSSILVLFLFSCGKVNVDQVQLGNWGTEHASLSVNGDSWYIEFDCAHATLEEPIAIIDGKFETAAKYFRESGVQFDDSEYYDAIPATVSGRLLSNDTLELTFLVGPDLEDYGTFVFVYDKEAMIYKCA